MATNDITMEELDDLLDEVEELITGSSKNLSRKNKNRKKDTANTGLTENGKCLIAYLGPTSSSSIDKPCSALRCIRCDFPVLELQDARWRPGTDYIFLRTNMPHAWKLAQQLEPRVGYVAYACQCSHHTATSLQSLKKYPNLPWVCRGHFENDTDKKFKK